MSNKNKTTRKCLLCEKSFVITSKNPQQKYCSYSCSNRATKTGKISHNFKSGTYKSKGYVMKLSKEHPSADRDGYVREHRLIMEKELKRYLTLEEHVHHKNGIKDDNRLVNLQVVNNGEHITYHNKGKRRWLGKKHTEKTKYKMSIARKAYFEKMGLYGY